MARQGVAAAVDLTPDQAEWYHMPQEVLPHITLAVNVNHEARELGPMTKMLLALTDWQCTQIPNLFFSHRQIERLHGREKTDHPDSSALLDSLPTGLWSQGPTDVGFCHSSPPVTFDLTDNTLIWHKQSPHKPVAEEGI